jgi:hypothetical protein
MVYLLKMSQKKQEQMNGKSYVCIRDAAEEAAGHRDAGAKQLSVDDETIIPASKLSRYIYKQQLIPQQQTRDSHRLSQKASWLSRPPMAAGDCSALPRS